MKEIHAILKPSDAFIIDALSVALQSQASAIQDALELALQYGSIDGAHHKMWVIDQMVRALAGDQYESWLADACQPEDGEEYTWDVGTAP